MTTTFRTSALIFLALLISGTHAWADQKQRPSFSPVCVKKNLLNQISDDCSKVIKPKAAKSAISCESDESLVKITQEACEVQIKKIIHSKCVDRELLKTDLGKCLAKKDTNGSTEVQELDSKFCKQGEINLTFASTQVAGCLLMKSIDSPQKKCFKLDDKKWIDTFCQASINQDLACFDGVGIGVYLDFPKNSEMSCKAASEKIANYSCLNSDETLFWNQFCSIDTRRLTAFDGPVCSGQMAVESVKQAGSSAVCELIANEELQTRCVSNKIYSKVQQQCPYSISGPEVCKNQMADPNSQAMLVLDKADSSCFNQIDLEEVTEKTMNNTGFLEKIQVSDSARAVIKKLVEKQEKVDLNQLNDFKSTLALITTNTEFTRETKSTLREFFLSNYFKKLKQDRKVKDLETVKTLLEDQTDWHERAQILYEYTNAFGGRHKMGILQNDTLFGSGKEKDVKMQNLGSGGEKKMNGCDLSIQLICGTGRRTLHCLGSRYNQVRGETKGTLVAACEISTQLKGKVEALNSTDKKALLVPGKKFEANFKGFDERLTNIIKARGPLAYCDSVHCALITLESEGLVRYDGNYTPSVGVRISQYMRRTVLSDRALILWNYNHMVYSSIFFQK